MRCIQGLNNTITNREKEVLQLIALEYTSKQIAELLYVSTSTVDTHRKKLLQKWHAKNAAGLVRIGFERGILTIRN